MVLYFYDIYRKDKENLLLLILSGVYTFSSIMSIVLYHSEKMSYTNVNILSTLLLFVLVVVSFSPLKRTRFVNDGDIKSLNSRFVSIFSYWLIFLYLPQVIMLIPESVSNYRNILYDFEFAADMYDEAAEATSQQTGHSFLNIFSVFRGAFSQILVFWSFYYFSLHNRRKTIMYLIWICLLYPFLASFAGGSRTGIVWWSFEILIAYLIFRNRYSRNIKRLITITLSTIASVVLLVFAILTLGRFATREYIGTNEVNNSLVVYSGSGQLNFSEYVIQNDVIQYGDNCFPLFRSVLGLSSSSNLYERQAKWGRLMNIKQGAFYTLYGDLCFDLSYFGALLFFLIIALRCSHKFSLYSQRASPLPVIFILYFYCCFLYNGLFYFSYKTIGGNLAIITNFIFYFMLKQIQSSNINE